MSAVGSDEAHYDVKIKAAELLLNHVEHTFVTSVFAGSASLRDAAGQLVENTVKSVRRGQTVDETYIDEMYEDITALYRLDQIGMRNSRVSSDREEMGKLPTISVLLLAVLAVVWSGMILYAAGAALKKRLALDRETKR